MKMDAVLLLTTVLFGFHERFLSWHFLLLYTDSIYADGYVAQKVKSKVSDYLITKRNLL